MKVKCDQKGIEHTVKIIQNNGVVIFPTDTVYGMGCDPFSSIAVEKIYSIKRRQITKLFPILGYSKNELSEIAELNEKHEKIIAKFWPGPLTIITKIKDAELTKTLKLVDKIAIRVPQSDCALKILKKCKLLVGTSANISGQKSFVDPKKCFEQFKDISVFVDGGKIVGCGESTIIELKDNNVKIVRKGKITKSELLHIL